MKKKHVIILGCLIVCVSLGAFFKHQKSLAALNMKDAVRINKAIGALFQATGQMPTESQAIKVANDLIQSGNIEGRVVGGKPHNRAGRPIQFTIVDFGAPGKPAVEINTQNEGMWGMFAYAYASELFEYPQQPDGAVTQESAPSAAP